MGEIEQGAQQREGSPRVKWGLVIHGGVGVIPPEEMTEELDAEYRKVLRESLQAGFHAMAGGGNAKDAIVDSIGVMEDSVIFNAGRGSNFTSQGVVSMDASIMVGDTLEAGAVAGVTDVRYPIRLARHVMEDCPHVMLAGPGAEAFAREVGMESTPADFFFTQRRWDDLQAAKAREAAGNAAPNTVDVEDALAKAAGAEPPPPLGLDFGTQLSADELKDNSGTVGAVALDASGMLVAGTSTGGSANKKWGRIGDSPVIAAGTYAGSHCGVSCTGWGEYFIRHAVAHDIQARMAYLGLSLREATHQVVKEKLEAQRRGLGGVVALDREGNVEMCYNTRGMYRGWVNEEGEIWVDVY
jgi:beta-aspartyl-peptidase (threonine type)